MIKNIFPTRLSFSSTRLRSAPSPWSSTQLKPISLQRKKEPSRRKVPQSAYTQPMFRWVKPASVLSIYLSIFSHPIRFSLCTPIQVSMCKTAHIKTAHILYIRQKATPEWCGLLLNDKVKVNKKTKSISNASSVIIVYLICFNYIRNLGRSQSLFKVLTMRCPASL